jgi:hypothetical protein
MEAVAKDWAALAASVAAMEAWEDRLTAGEPTPAPQKASLLD